VDALHWIVVHMIDGVPWFWITVGCNTFIYVLELVLDILQGLRMRHYGYSKRILHFDYSRFESTFGFLFECLVLILGSLVVLWDFTINKLQEFGYGSEYQILRGVTYIFVISFLSSLVRAPAEVLRVVWEAPPGRRWRATLRMAADQIGIFLLSFVVGVPLLAMTLALLCWDLPFKWLLTSIYVSVVAVLVSDIYPVVLAPLFNTYAPLEDGELRNEIIHLANKLKFPLKGVYTVDGSKRSDHSNAYLMGFWSSSIVLYDNLIKQLSTREILAILGHEIGHHKLKHTWKHLIVQLVFMGNFIFLFSKVVNSPHFYQSFGFEQPDTSIGLVLFSYLYSTFANFLRFVTNLVQRRFEYAADAFALQQGLPLRQALIKLNGVDNASSSVLPDPLYSLYHFAHPPLSERLAWMSHYGRNYKKDREVLKN
jgi:STE24 endopeptidase